MTGGGGMARHASMPRAVCRQVLPPALRNIAFIGQLATFQHVLTTALQVQWSVRHE